MFLYWDGYEIDGSDTDFNIVLPESVQLLEITDCFLEVPIFDKDSKPRISYYKGNKEKIISYEELKEKIRSGENRDFYISKNCCHMEELDEKLKQEIYSISEQREPHEEAYGKVQNPCTAPLKQIYFERGEMTVTLCVGNYKYQPMDEEPLGYVTNISLLQGVSGLPRVQINVGPSFYYEYAMFIISYLIDRFPSIATYGGLDCEGGWTHGCTYSSSIYAYEKISVPVIYSVKNTLKHLCEYDILCPGIQYYKGKWKYERTEEFVLADGMVFFMEQRKDKNRMSFPEYADFSETILSSNISAFEIICKTAVCILIPKPEVFKENPKAFKRLEEAASILSGEDYDWEWMGYFCFAIENGQRMVQFRVRYKLRTYLQTLLSLCGEGEIEFMKQITYGRRHEK